MEDAAGDEDSGITPVARLVSLRPAKHAGDIYYTPASTFFIEHGHVGIHTEPKVVVEAVGSISASRPIRVSDIKVSKGAVQQSVNTTQRNRNEAVKKANGLVGRPYNINFAANRFESWALNCSQLVWVAYKNGAGLDIDKNGGWGVYPKDVRDSKLTKTYRWY